MSAFSIAGLIQEVVETSRDWKEIFQSNFGKPGNLAIQAADEAFYHLLEKGKHAAVVAVWKTNWPFVLRAGILRSFMTGKSVEKDKDGNHIEHAYPAAPREQSEEVAAAVAPLLMQRIMSLPVASRPVDREYWFVDKEAGKRFDTAPVSLAISAMHALLNITEDLGDLDGRRAVARAWIAKFGTLPGPVFYRIKDIFDHAPTPAAKPEPVTPAPQNDTMKRQLTALRQTPEPVTPAEAAEFSAAVGEMGRISPDAINGNDVTVPVPDDIVANKLEADNADDNRRAEKARKNGNNHKRPHLRPNVPQVPASKFADPAEISAEAPTESAASAA